MKTSIQIIVVLFIVFSLGFFAGYYHAKARIINNALENRKDCNDLEDIRIIINK